MLKLMDIKENIYNFSDKNFVYLNLCATLRNPVRLAYNSQEMSSLIFYDNEERGEEFVTCCSNDWRFMNY